MPQKALMLIRRKAHNKHHFLKVASISSSRKVSLAFFH